MAVSFDVSQKGVKRAGGYSFHVIHSINESLAVL